MLITINYIYNNQKMINKSIIYVKLYKNKDKAISILTYKWGNYPYKYVL